MKPAPFSYVRAGSVAEAVGLLDAIEGDVRVLAGGQSLVPLMNFRLARPETVIDLNFVTDASHIDVGAGEIAVGAMARQRAVERDPEVFSRLAILRHALIHVGHPQIRNRGTIGGSIAHADPSAELPAVAVALDAAIVVVSVRGRRSIPAAKFFQGPFTTTLVVGEIVSEVRFPSNDINRSTVVEIAQRPGDFALAGVVAAVTHDGVAMSAFGVGSTPVRLDGAEAVLSGGMSDSAVREASDAARDEVDPIDDIHADAEYRREAVATLVERALKEIRT